MMQCYAAPMEGITGYIYRNAHARNYKGVDKYFTPFITPRIKKMWMTREMNDILPEHNGSLPLIPQILTNKSQELIRGAKDLQQRGYTEVNINLGCPSGTVVSKKRGSGFLQDVDALRYFFEEYFANCDVPLSVKTRLGMFAAQEYEIINALYNEFPFTEIIVHARVREDYYKNPVNYEGFGVAYEKSRHPLCYNGDLFKAEDMNALQERFPDLHCVMLGRGMIANPQLPEQIKFGGNRDLLRLKAFMEDVCAGYEEVLSGNKNALYKMKEIWFYMAGQFACIGKYEKKIKKSKTLEDYRVIVNALFAEEMASGVL